MGTSIVKVTPHYITKELRWYSFRQNNSGGSFYYDDNLGIEVFIEATSTREANSRAEDLGIYFNGCSEYIDDDGEWSGRDCPCCGDRWYEAYGDGEVEFPKIHLFIRDKGFQTREYALLDNRGNMKNGYDVFHYYNGTKQYGIPQLLDGEEESRVI